MPRSSSGWHHTSDRELKIMKSVLSSEVQSRKSTDDSESDNTVSWYYSGVRRWWNLADGEVAKFCWRSYEISPCDTFIDLTFLVLGVRSSFLNPNSIYHFFLQKIFFVVSGSAAGSRKVPHSGATLSELDLSGSQNRSRPDPKNRLSQK